MTGWMQLDGKFYYLHTDGRMVIGWQSDGTNKYYMDTVSGVMAGAGSISIRAGIISIRPDI